MIDIPAPVRKNWEKDSACRPFYEETGYDAWFGPDDGLLEALTFEEGWEARREARKVALKICRSCPVRAECLRQAMRTEDPNNRYGIWGGLTTGQRTKLANKLAAAKRVMVA